MQKEYTYKNVKFGYSPTHRKWMFNVKNFTFYLAVKNGKSMAEKISHLVAAGFIRSKEKGLDNMARANIYNLNSKE